MQNSFITNTKPSVRLTLIKLPLTNTTHRNENTQGGEIIMSSTDSQVMSRAKQLLNDHAGDLINYKADKKLGFFASTDRLNQLIVLSHQLKDASFTEDLKTILNRINNEVTAVPNMLQKISNPPKQDLDATLKQ